MMNLGFDYDDCIRASEKVQWRIDDVLGREERLDFNRPFLPGDLVKHVTALGLPKRSELLLNQIAGNAYLNLFQFVEEYILATMMDHAQAELFGDGNAMRALTRMVDEELKHQMLFKRFRERFDKGFGHSCGVLENASEVAAIIMGHSPVAVMLITLHIEWMTQNHYTESVRQAERVDPLFKKLLHNHWLEESQHGRIDLLELEKLGPALDEAGWEAAVGEYLGIIDAMDALLAQQVEMDLSSYDAVDGPGLEDVDGVRVALHQSYRRTFIWYGMTHKNLIRAISAFCPSGAQQVAEKAAHFE